MHSADARQLRHLGNCVTVRLVFVTQYGSLRLAGEEVDLSVFKFIVSEYEDGLRCISASQQTKSDEFISW